MWPLCEADAVVEGPVAGIAEQQQVVLAVVGMLGEEDDVVEVEGVGVLAGGGFTAVAGAAADAAGGVDRDVARGMVVGGVVGVGGALVAGSLPA